MLRYAEISDKEKSQFHRIAVQLYNKEKIGSRLISRLIKSRHKILIPEITISNWLYNDRIPGRNKSTWFKPRKPPKRDILLNLYLEKGMSPTEISKKFNVVGNTVRKWLTKYNVVLRNKKESMNTKRVKTFLRNFRLIIPPKPFKKITSEKAYILGVLCGDGHINEDFVQLEINKKDEDFIKFFIKCFKDVYGLGFNYNFRPKRNTFAAYISPEFICNDLLSIGKFGVRKWRVPQIIMTSRNKDIISSFLRGFFDSEGCVARNFITCDSVNGKGLLGVTKLLTKLRINTSFKKYYKNFKSPRRYSYYVYYVNIYGKENILRFRDTVNFTLLRKKEKLFKLYEN
ncbi:MAG: hypothetical protein HYW23_02405 [Candidatus Aenigmarchaeota archaeon]|nr:hypothetical protein [Candidatus Aenigmarchaeota archaeon]